MDPTPLFSFVFIPLDLGCRGWSTDFLIYRIYNLAFFFTTAHSKENNYTFFYLFLLVPWEFFLLCVAVCFSGKSYMSYLRASSSCLMDHFTFFLMFINVLLICTPFLHSLSPLLDYTLLLLTWLYF